MRDGLDIIAVNPVHAAKCNRVLRLGLQVALGRVRRKPATARISGERDVMQIGVAGLFLGGRVEPGSGFCFGSGVL
jgi:hypothetical protein